MAVLHYISEMHEMGHTRRIIISQASISEQGDLDESPQRGKRTSSRHQNDHRDGGDDTPEEPKRALSDPDVRTFRVKRWEGTLEPILGDVGGTVAPCSDRSGSSVFGETQSGEGVSAMREVMSRFDTLFLRLFEACYRRYGALKLTLSPHYLITYSPNRPEPPQVSSLIPPPNQPNVGKLLHA